MRQGDGATSRHGVKHLDVVIGEDVVAKGYRGETTHSTTRRTCGGGPKGMVTLSSAMAVAGGRGGARRELDVVRWWRCGAGRAGLGVKVYWRQQSQL